MERRLFLAIALSILVLMLYSSIASRFYPQLQQKKSPEVPFPEKLPASSQPETTPTQTELITPEIYTMEESLINLNSEELAISVTHFGTGIKEYKFNNYDSVLPLSNIGSVLEWQGVEFKKHDTTNGISMSYDDKNKRLEILKCYRVTESPYIIEMDLEFITYSNTNSYVKYSLNLGSMSADFFKQNPMDQRYVEISISLPNKVLRKHFLGFNPTLVDEKIQWAGIRDRYYCVIFRPLQDVGKLSKSQNMGLTSYILDVPAVELIPGQKVKHTYLLYIGPQKTELIEKLGGQAENIVHFGVFDPISHIFLGILKLLYRVSRNWGISIILFSLLVFIIMSPLSIKSFSSMKKMQEIQPQVEELRVTYKDNPQKLHKEIMELYRVNKINPFGGCLPLFLQFPIFIALYQTLMRFVDLKGAQFLWIKDLSRADRLFVFPNKFPVIGNEFNLLPIIMIVTMLVQQKLSSVKKEQESETAKQQKMTGLFMAVFFGIIFYQMPSGLVLYWTVNSILMLIFQIRVFGKVVVPKIK